MAKPRDWQAILRAAGARGATVVLRGAGHVQIKGPLLVNYWPDSSRRTAYVAGTKFSRNNVTPEQAVAMAFELPKLTPGAKRRQYTKIKYRMFERQKRCYWCFCVLTLETATVDHVIPLSRGGLDNDNNRKLACQPCNVKRGNGMPELSGGIGDTN